MSKLVSVIVPFYNPPKLRFRKCIESLIQQTYSNLEIIMINDGSEDHYKIIVDEYIINELEKRLEKLKIIWYDKIPEKYTATKQEIFKIL